MTALLGLASAQDPATYGLQEGELYDGASLMFLIRRPTAPQFANLARRTDAAFTPMTGISVEWGDVPFGPFQGQIQMETTFGSGAYDLVAWVDSQGPSFQNFVVPLSEMAEEVGLSNFPDAFVEAARMGTDTVYGVPLRGHPQMLFYRHRPAAFRPGHHDGGGGLGGGGRSGYGG